MALEFVTLGADHHLDFDGDSTDQIGSANGTNTSVIFTDAAIALDATNCMTVNALTDRVTLPTLATINNAAQQRKAVVGWYMTTAIQAPPTRIYGEGDQNTAFQIVMALGNACMLEVIEPTNFTIQIYGPVLQPNRAYHFAAIFLGNTQGNLVKFFVDGIEQTNAEPSDRQPDTADLNSRGVGEFGDAAGTTGVGGGVVLLQAARNGRYQHWGFWGDEADADLTDNEVRVELFEKQALADVVITTDTLANMQIALNALSGTTRPDAPLCIDIQPVTGGGDFTLDVDDITFPDEASMHFRYTGTADTLTLRNTNGSNASSLLSNAPFDGTGALIIATVVTVTITVLDVNTGSPIEGARVYMEAGATGDLTQGDVIVNTRTNALGIVTFEFDYTTDQSLQFSSVSKGTRAPYYVDGVIAGPITAQGLTQTVFLIPD